METIFLILLFIAPGMLVRQMRLYMKDERYNEQPIYEYMFEIVVDSVIVAGITVFILYNGAEWDVLTVNDLLEKLMRFDYLTLFSISAFCVSLAWYLVKFRWIKPGILTLKNKRLEKTEHMAHTDQPRIWEVVQKEQGILDTWQVVSIYKDEQYVISGMIAGYSRAQNPEMEILIEHAGKVEKLMTEHQELFTDWYDYYNVSNGLRVKFYNQAKIKEHWNTFYPDEPTS